VPDRDQRGIADLRWLKDHAWPLWLEHGIDRKRRAFHEHLDLKSLQCTASFRRLRVATRQTYVFARAAAHGVPGAHEAVAIGLDFLAGPARHADGGYAWRFDLDNRPTDHTRDLYDHAFVLLALSAAAPVVGAEAVRRDARALVEFVTRHLRHAQGGYEESLPPAMPRRQNPHMHLFEALLAAGDAFGDDIYLAAADDLAALFVRRLYQPREGALPEFFDATLAPQRDGGRFLVEPGHHYEWVWLIDCHAAATARRADLTAASDVLLAFADRYAIDPATGLVVNGLWSDGAVQDSGFRLWPQTERVKAEARRGDAHLARALTALERHFAGVPPGLWIERMDGAGRATGEPAPATSLYHLTAALTDYAVLRAGAAAGAAAQ
jgi:mannose/cellobiose epimerase-like protein (N-acyl-D-glucosamine 2-epimerase family)